jgi:hypothetical protein
LRAVPRQIDRANALTRTWFQTGELAAHFGIDCMPFLVKLVYGPLRRRMPASDPIRYRGAISAVTE